ncbi:MAG: ABC transporter permease [Acidobacteria bacterium]|nr:ABC transporter permease [Acidobacteriota bacterium]
MPSLQIFGSTDNMYEMTDKSLEDGRFFTAEEVTRAANVCVIGTDVKEKFFESTSPVGKILKVRGIPLEIIGVEGKRGSFLGQSRDRMIYIPITLHNKMFARTGGIQIHGKAENKEMFQLAIDEAKLLLRNRRQLVGSDEETFSIVNTEEFGSQMDQFTGAIAAVVVPITMIILIVGGIVVMNIMLVSVTERTFEVGLRKASGRPKSRYFSSS